MSKSEFLYRVCTLNSLDESVEEEYNLPGGKFSLTGFFYQTLHNAIALWTERDNSSGGTWSEIIRVQKASCTLEKKYKQYKNGHDCILDQNECFVSKIDNAIIERYINGMWEPISASIFKRTDKNKLY